MEKTILITIKPFTLYQRGTIIDNEKVIKTFELSMNKIEENILKLAENEDAFSIVISGPKVYTKGIQKKIEKEASLKNYNKNMLKIELL